MPFKEVTAKLGNMRKAVEWTVYPRSSSADADHNKVIIQSDKRICQFDIVTRKGMLSSGKGGHPGFHALHPFLGAVEIEVPQSLVDECLANQPKPGDVLHGVMTIG